MVQQMRGKRVTQGMRRQGRRDTRLLRVLLDDDPVHLPRPGAAAPRDEQRIVLLAVQDDATRLFHVALDPDPRLLAERHQHRYTLELPGSTIPPQNGMREKCLTALALM